MRKRFAWNGMLSVMALSDVRGPIWFQPSPMFVDLLTGSLPTLLRPRTARMPKIAKETYVHQQ
jgi:hypothetical protein